MNDRRKSGIRLTKRDRRLLKQGKLKFVAAQNTLVVFPKLMAWGMVKI